MNILNQSPPNGHPAFPAARGPSHHHQQHQDACQNLIPVALPLHPSSPLRSSQLPPCRSTIRMPLRVELEPSQREGAGLPAVKTQLARRQSSTVVGSINNICKVLSHLLDSSGDGHSKFPGPATSGTHHHDVTAEGECKAGGSAGDVQLLQPCPTTNTLGSFVRSLLEDHKLSLIEDAVGDVGRLLRGPESTSVTLAVSVSSAVKLEGRQMDLIAKKMRRLTGFSSVRLENTVDPSLIAGFVISYGVGDAHVIDLSVKGRLAELEAQLESSDQSSAEGWNLPSNGHW